MNRERHNLFWKGIDCRRITEYLAGSPTPKFKLFHSLSRKQYSHVVSSYMDRNLILCRWEYAFMVIYIPDKCINFPANQDICSCFQLMNISKVWGKGLPGKSREQARSLLGHPGLEHQWIGNHTQSPDSHGGTLVRRAHLASLAGPCTSNCTAWLGWGAHVPVICDTQSKDFESSTQIGPLILKAALCHI